MEKISILGFLLVILYLITRDLACKNETLEGNCLRADREVLLDFKNGNFCQWEGIGCGNNIGVVISINLHNPYSPKEAYENWSSMNLSEEIQPSLIELKSLRSLDLSGNSLEHIPIPKFFGSLKILQYLNLANCGFRGAISPTLGNLSNLQFLDLSSYKSYQLFVKDLEWMTSLVSLRHLKMNYVDLSMVGSQWMEVLYKFSFLTKLHLQDCGLFGSISSLSLINFTSLSIINISGNFFWSKFPIWLLNLSSLVYIVVSFNQLYGQISPSLGELPNLQHLDLSWNENLTEHLDLHPNTLTGSFLEFLKEIKYCSCEGLLPKLSYLDLSWNQLVGKLPKRLSQLKKFTQLHLYSNELQGSIPASFGTLKNLNEMSLRSNELSGSLLISFGQLSELVDLDVSWNRLTGILSKEHFSKLSKLKTFWIQENSGLVLNLWSQKEVLFLDLSNASISSSIPNWFWNISSNLWSLSLLNNQLQVSFGQLFKLVDLDVSYNRLTGTLSEEHFSKLSKLKTLWIQENSGLVLNVSSIWVSSFQITDLNMVSCNLGPSFPTWLRSQKEVLFLDLSNASILGSIPKWFWNNSFNLQYLSLSHNPLQGQLPNSLKKNLVIVLPPSFQNLSRLELLDLSHNQLSCKVSSWIGTAFINLVILNLRSNVFFGRLPSQLSNLSSLHVLDLAQNNLMGEIPITLVELKATVQEYNKNIYPLYDNVSKSLYEEQLVVIMKGQSLEYTRTLSLVVDINLSNNNLSGENHIIGQILESISILHRLLSLDLSSNKLSVNIPSSMDSLTFLSYLNLSNNNFSSKIPFIGQMTTFTESAFVGNSNLCGAPLVIKCQDEDLDKKHSAIEDKNDGGSIIQWFNLSVGLGFAIGILVPYFVLTKRKSWCEAYFDFVDKIIKWLLRRRATYAKDHLRM
ncbi:hypothetical protein PVL29_004669 [Vitis rotundifolia]|uniref:Disease resistance R13L4/SHOC-2-like LRR domain-containing protein n=1 Tax=Vitis rotundifolia TaxID=103349 RepID=A0AA39A8R8_VITRO|nr:hypothetical protein PVL29_004669 [Vitis rotundifolia]